MDFLDGLRLRMQHDDSGVKPCLGHVHGFAVGIRFRVRL